MLKNFRRSYWILSTFLTKHFGKMFLTAVITVATLVFLPRLTPYIPTGKPHRTIGRVGQFTINSLPSDIKQLISSGLTDIAPDGSATPSLALKWTSQDNGQKYTFTLDDTQVWQDGTPFQAADIHLPIEDIEKNVTSSTTIEFKLPEPFAPFPTVVSTPIFRQTKTLSRIFKRTKNQLIGTDDFAVSKINIKNQLVTHLSLESPEEKRTYKFYNTQSSAILGFKLGEVDVLENLTDTSQLDSWSNVDLTQNSHQDRYVAVFFNTQDPTLSDKAFRQALTYAIPDKPEDQSRALGPIHPDSWAYNPKVKAYPTSLKRAQDLISDLVDEDQSITIRLDTTLAYLGLADKIKSAWKELGINTEVRVISFLPQDYQALLAVHQIPPDPDQYTLWHSTQATNLTRLQSPKIDKLLEDGRKTINQSERKEIYLDFQRFLLEESPAAFLFYQTTYTVSRK